MAGGGDDHPPPASSTRETPSLSSLLTLFIDSFKILLLNPKLFVSIFLLFSLPLSLLLSSLSFSSATLRRRISHLESLASIISVRIEALNILEEARKDAKSLFFLRASYFLPTLLLSTLTLISVSRRRFAFASAWWRCLLTGSVSHLSIAGFGQLSRTASVAMAAVSGPVLSLLLGLVFGAAEIYLTAVFGVGIVVSVMEERFGLDAIRVGSGLMAGRRVVGWAVAGSVAAVTAVIGWEMVGMEEIDVYGADWKGFESTAGMEVGRKAGLVFLYGLVILWSNLVFTVYYSDCSRRRKLVVDDEDDQIMLVHTINVTRL